MEVNLQKVEKVLMSTRQVSSYFVLIPSSKDHKCKLATVKNGKKN